MGNAADNERIKLRATFFNNCGVGLLVAGFLVPFLTIATKSWDIAHWLAAFLSGEGRLNSPIVAGAIANVAALILGLWGGAHLRNAADEEIQKLDG